MAYPAFRSDVFSIEPSLYRTDRFNETREDLSHHIADLRVDGDAERIGSLLRLDVTTYQDVLNDGDWVAPYLTYAPETGDIVTVQMGHYRLDPPSVVYDGTGSVRVDAIGVDILDLLQAATLPETFYTPASANLMQDIRVLVQMATRGAVGVNMVQNPSFENESSGNLVGWANNGSWAAGGSGTITFTPPSLNDLPSGERVWGVTFSPAQPPGAYASVYQDITIPSHMIGQRVWVSGLWRPAHYDHRAYISVNFYDASSVLISGSGFSTPEVMRPPSRWTREHAHGVIPHNAVRARVRCYVKDAVGGAGAQRRSSWDDITFQTITGEPIPDHRLALPTEPIISNTRIQSDADTSFLEAINTRYKAAGYEWLFTTMDGKLTTRKSATEGEAAARTYTDDDSRVVGERRIDIDPRDRYNIVRAIKEDLDTGVLLSVQVENRNPDDPWNIYGEMGQVPVTIVVQDAVDEAALRAAALEHLALSSLQEELTLSTLPDPTLGLHDVVAVESGNRTGGIRAVKAIRWGMTADDPLVEVVARRTIRGVV